MRDRCDHSSLSPSDASMTYTNNIRTIMKAVKTTYGLAFRRIPSQLSFRVFGEVHRANKHQRKERQESDRLLAARVGVGCAGSDSKPHDQYRQADEGPPDNTQDDRRSIHLLSHGHRTRSESLRNRRISLRRGLCGRVWSRRLLLRLLRVRRTHLTTPMRHVRLLPEEGAQHLRNPGLVV